MKNNIEETEKKLFDEIQVMVERLPWDHKTNLDYFTACVHEAGHGVAYVRICQDLGNPFRAYQCTFEVGRSAQCPQRLGQAINHCKVHHKFLFSFIPVLIHQLGTAAGYRLTNEFYHKYYGWARLKSSDEIIKEYGGAYDDKRLRQFGLASISISNFILQASYKDPLVRLTHLNLIRDLLRGRGLLEIDPRTYLK